MKTFVSLIIFLSFHIITFSQLVQKISLPEPQKEIGMPLMQALNNRQSSRSFDPEKNLSNQEISNILWAAYGINRTNGKRTAPSSQNQQEFTIYVALKGGLFIWDSQANILNQISSSDLRASTGLQDYVAHASMNLIYVADFSKMTKCKTDEERMNTAHIDCGFIAQNVNLYVASQGLVCCVRAYFDKVELSKLLNLNTNQNIILTHSIGYQGK